MNRKLLPGLALSDARTKPTRADDLAERAKSDPQERDNYIKFQKSVNMNALPQQSMAASCRLLVQPNY